MQYFGTNTAKSQNIVTAASLQKRDKPLECNIYRNEFVIKLSMNKPSKVGQLYLFMKGKKNYECDSCGNEFVTK